MVEVGGEMVGCRYFQNSISDVDLQITGHLALGIPFSMHTCIYMMTRALGATPPHSLIRS